MKILLERLYRLKEEYFSNRIETIVFQQINNFITKYNNLPTKDTDIN